MQVKPLGAAGTVTGSRFLLLSDGVRVLVDCGLFQGLKSLRLRNWEPFPVPLHELDAIVLTHAHLDHTGYLPVLVRDGFRGKVHLTRPTTDLLPILLEDAGRLQEEDAEWANRKGFSKHHPALPLFTEDDAIRVEDSFQSHSFGKEWEIEGLRFRYHRAGHILGAASVEVRAPDGDSVFFSGDLGRSTDRLLPPPEPRVTTRTLIMESTYGDRIHSMTSPEEALAEALNGSLRRGGVAMIASFAVGRAQTIALLIHRLMESGEVPEVPVYLNSPMAIEVTRVHMAHAAELRPDFSEVLAAMDRQHATATVEASKALNRRRGPMVIIAGAGMLTGGRILHHLVAFWDDSRNSLILPGFQAEGTRGRALLRGEQELRIHGQSVPIRCRVRQLDQISGHADADELVGWASSTAEPEGGVVLVHGEREVAEGLRKRLTDQLGWERVAVAAEGRTYP
jgi:metallo-beta-lactamase family protein